MNLLLFGADVAAKIHADSETLTGLAREQFWGILICFIVAAIGLAIFNMILTTKRETSRDNILNDTFKSFSEKTSDLTTAIIELKGVIEKRLSLIETRFNAVESNVNDVSDDINSVSVNINNISNKVDSNKEKLEEHTNILSEHEETIARHDTLIKSHDEALSSLIGEQPKKRTPKKK